MTFSPDTAPVMNKAVTLPLDPLDARLTTSRPLVAGGTVPPKSGSNLGVAIGVFATTLVVGLATGGFFFFKQRSAAPTPPTQIVTNDPKPVEPPPPPIVSAAPPATMTAPPTASAQPATATIASAKPQTTTTTTKPTTTHGAKPAQPATDQSMMNERF